MRSLLLYLRHSLNVPSKCQNQGERREPRGMVCHFVLQPSLLKGQLWVACGAFHLERQPRTMQNIIQGDAESTGDLKREHQKRHSAKSFLWITTSFVFVLKSSPSPYRHRLLLRGGLIHRTWMASSQKMFVPVPERTTVVFYWRVLKRKANSSFLQLFKNARLVIFPDTDMYLLSWRNCSMFLFFKVKAWRKCTESYDLRHRI